MIDGRATTDEQKKQIMDQLLEQWKLVPALRLGQLLCCAEQRSPSGEVLFNIEDYHLAALTERFVESR